MPRPALTGLVSATTLADAPAPRAAAQGGLVLVADDEAKVRRLVERMLTAEGYEVIGAGDGQSAIEQKPFRRDALLAAVYTALNPDAG